VKRLPVCLRSYTKMVPKRSGVGFYDTATIIPLSIPTLGLLMIEVNVVPQHSGSEAFPIKCSLGTISLNASMSGTVPTLSVFTVFFFSL
jgi:hypothetical protein